MIIRRGLYLLMILLASLASRITSPYYHLKSDDVVYVAPNKTKVATTSTTKQWLPAVVSAMSFTVIVTDRVSRD